MEASVHQNVCVLDGPRVFDVLRDISGATRLKLEA